MTIMATVSFSSRTPCDPAALVVVNCSQAADAENYGCICSMGQFLVQAHSATETCQP